MTCFVCHRPFGNLKECPYCDEPVLRLSWEKRLMRQITLTLFCGMGLLAYSLWFRRTSWSPAPNCSVTAILLASSYGAIALWRSKDFSKLLAMEGIVIGEVWLMVGVAYLYPKAFYIAYAIIEKHGVWLLVAACLAFSFGVRQPSPIPIFASGKCVYLLLVPKIHACLVSGLLVGIVVLVLYANLPSRIVYSTVIGVIVGAPLVYKDSRDVIAFALKRYLQTYPVLTPVLGLWACYPSDGTWADPLPVSVNFATMLTAVAFVLGGAWLIQRKYPRLGYNAAPLSRTRNIILAIFAVIVLAKNGISGLGVALVSTAWTLSVTWLSKRYDFSG